MSGAFFGINWRKLDRPHAAVFRGHTRGNRVNAQPLFSSASKREGRGGRKRGGEEKEEKEETFGERAEGKRKSEGKRKKKGEKQKNGES